MFGYSYIPMNTFWVILYKRIESQKTECRIDIWYKNSRHKVMNYFINNFTNSANYIKRRHILMETRNQCIAKPLDDMSSTKALNLISKNIKVRTIQFLAFSEKSFYVLIFVLLIMTTANIALIDILLVGIEKYDSSKIFLSFKSHIY